MEVPPDPYGLLSFLHWNHHWNNYHFPDKLIPKALDQLESLEVRFIRMDLLWSDLYREGQPFDPTHLDWLVNEIKKKNINILGLLQYNKITHGPNGEILWNLPPRSLDEFSAYVNFTVSHFKDRIGFWEIWNEPNHPLFWVGDRTELKSYTNLLKKSYQAAKSANPTCRILNGGITDPIGKDVAHLYKHGAKDFMDILAIHTFLDPLSTSYEARFDEILNDIYSIMEKKGDTKKDIWITEMGCPGVPAGIDSPTWFAGKSLNEDSQGLALEKQFGLLKKHPRIKKMFWAFYRDTENEFKDATDYLGLVRFDLSPKPSFGKFQKLIQNYYNNSIV